MPLQTAPQAPSSSYHPCRKGSAELWKIYNVICQILFITIGFDDLTDEYVMVGKINNLDQSAFHIDGTLPDHWRWFQLSLN